MYRLGIKTLKHNSPSAAADPRCQLEIHEHRWSPVVGGMDKAVHNDPFLYT